MKRTRSVRRAYLECSYAISQFLFLSDSPLLRVHGIHLRRRQKALKESRPLLLQSLTDIDMLRHWSRHWSRIGNWMQVQLKLLWSQKFCFINHATSHKYFISMWNTCCMFLLRTVLYWRLNGKPDVVDSSNSLARSSAIFQEACQMPLLQRSNFAI